MNEELLKAIHQELVAIRQLLAEGAKAAPARATPARSGAASTASYASSSSSSSFASRGSEEVPQPTEIVPNAGEVKVHFGKNNGVALSALSERSLSWYAQEQAPRLDSSGNPYPARPQETILRNAARTLWHQNKGTLGAAGAAPAKAAASDDFIEPAQASDEEALPF